MNIIIDGDSFPFKDEILKIAKEFQVQVIMVLSVSHYSKEINKELEIILVDNYKEAADMKIFNITSPEDIVITGDFGLAALLLTKNTTVISPRGMVFNTGDIDYLLAIRHKEAKLRRGGKKTRGPDNLSSEDRERFSSVIFKLLKKK